MDDVELLWNKLEAIDVKYLLDGSYELVMQASKIIIDLVENHDFSCSQVEQELRERKLHIWIYGDNPTSFAMFDGTRVPLKCMNIRNKEKQAEYAFSVCIGSEAFFRKNTLEILGLTYETSFERLDKCGVYVIQQI